MANDAATSLRNEYTIQLMKLPKKVCAHIAQSSRSPSLYCHRLKAVRSVLHSAPIWLPA